VVGQCLRYVPGHTTQRSALFDVDRGDVRGRQRKGVTNVTMPNISGSTPQGGGVSLRCFGEGRLVLVFPKEEKTGHAFGKPSEPKQFMLSNVVMLPDGAPSIQLPTGATLGPLPTFITYGGEMNNLGQMVKPDTTRVDVGPQGTLFENISIGGGGMLYILRAALRNGEARVGRLWKDPAYNGAWKLTTIDQGTPEYQAAVNWMGAYSTGNFVNPSPVPLQPIPQQAAPQQQPTAWPSNPAPQSATVGAWGAQVQQNTPPAQQGWGAQQQPVAAQQPQQGWGQPPAQQGWGAPAQDPNAGQPSPGF
jgi:hypothetical protein